MDPDHDDTTVLRRYADANHVDWTLLTGSNGAVKRLANSFAVALEGQADPGQLNFGILHSGHLILVDGQGTIRGYYKSNETRARPASSPTLGACALPAEPALAPAAAAAGGRGVN